MIAAAAPGCPVANGNLKIEEAGNEVIVFDSGAQVFHLLNATAYSILKACNGLNDAKGIGSMLALQFGGADLDAVTRDVEETISQFQSGGLVMHVLQNQSQSPSSAVANDGSLLAISLSGTSMFPVLLSGDRVLVKRSSLEELQTGDIVVWSDDTLTLVAHRIVSIDNSPQTPLITTKGDLCVEADAPISIQQVAGKVVAVLREGGVQWISELEKRSNAKSDGTGQVDGEHRSKGMTAAPRGRPSFKRMKVLDLREISAESIRNIESVEDISLVLLCPENAAAWPDVATRDVRTVFTVDESYRVYTGQPELLPELLEFMEAPLRLVVSGQLFLTGFHAPQILAAFDHLILLGQAYVGSVDSKAALASVTKIVSGEICVVPHEHNRWIGPSVLGPEYVTSNHGQPLVAVGELHISQRMGGSADAVSLFHNLSQRSSGSPDDSSRQDTASQSSET